MHAVVISHGPAPVTRRAVRRLRRIGAIEGLWVVAARRGGERRVAGIAGARPVSGFGTLAVRELVAGLGDEPVLIVHDDVAITSSGVDAMLSLLTPGVDFVAPHTNEVGTPQFVTALPPADEAGVQLDRVSGLGSARRLASARYSCLLGRGSSFASLTGTLVVPGASLVRSEVCVVLAPVAAAHDLTCHVRLAPDGGDRPIMVASMIVRDEERHLEDALRSVAGLVDRVEICDTGSVDSTIRIAESLGANVRTIEWREDFAWARNQALEACRDADFVLVLDADERVVADDPETFRRWLRTWRDELTGVLIELRNHRGEGMAHSTHRAMRVAATDGARWHGALHESIRFDGNRRASSVFYAGLVIDHLGYAGAVVAEKGKARRNIGISRAAFERDPNPKTMIDYARSLRMEDEGDLIAESLFRTALADLRPEAPAMVRSYLLGTVAAYELARGRSEEACRLAREALHATPQEDLAQLTLARAMTDSSDWIGLVAVWEDIAGRPSPSPMFGVEQNRQRFEILVSRALAVVGRFDDAVRLLAGVLGAAPESVGDMVGDLIPALIDAGIGPDRMVPAVVADRFGLVITALAGLAEPPVVARIAAEALEAGARHGTLFTTGFAASLIRPGTDLPDRLAVHAELAPRDLRPGLADMAVRRGRPDLADRFRDAPPAPLVLSGELFS